MARRTPPVADQVVDAKITSTANIKKRLIDFDTNSSLLEYQHKEWLSRNMRYVGSWLEFHITIYSYASKMGSPARNKELSIERMHKVQKHLQDINNQVYSNSLMMIPKGEEVSEGRESDNSAMWRAVEVHFFDKTPPWKPPGEEVKPNVIPLPGGLRYKEWSIAAPGSFTIALVSYNIIVIKNEKTGEKRGYSQPAFGGGWSLDMKLLGLLIQGITDFSMLKLEYVPITSNYPITWEEIEKSSVDSDALAQGDSFSAAFIFKSSIYHHGSAGLPFKTLETIIEFESGGGTIGIGFFTGTGILIRTKIFDSL